MWLTVQGKETGCLSIRKWKTEQDARKYIRDSFTESLEFVESAMHYDGDFRGDIDDSVFEKYNWFCGESNNIFYWYQLIDIGDYDDRIMIGGSIGCGMETNVITAPEIIDIWHDTEKKTHEDADEDGFFETRYGEEYHIQTYNNDSKWFCSIIYNNTNYDYVVIIPKKSLEERDWWIQEEIYD